MWTKIVDLDVRPSGVEDYQFVYGAWIVFMANWDPIPTHWQALPELP